MARTAATGRTAATSRSDAPKGRRAAAPRPARVHELFLGYACNERCLFCSQEFAWRRQPFVAFEDAARRAWSAYRGGARVLVVNGGEPTLYDGLERLVALARKTGYPEVHIQTNGLRLADRGYAASLRRAGLTLARFSIPGHTPELHDAQVQVPGAFEKAWAGLENLRALGAAVGVNMVLNRLNAPTLAESCAWFLERGVGDIGFIFPLYEGDMAVYAQRTALSMTDAAAAVRRAFAEFRARRAEPPFLLNFTPCVLPGYEGRTLRWSGDAAALYDGAQTLLIDPATYRLDRPEGGKGLADSAAENKSKPEACASCVYAPRCLGVERRYLERFGPGEFTPLASVPAPFHRGWKGVRSWRRVLSPRETAALRGAS
ncbi:MAG: radical SAM protein [Elusimicrobia bacterium]|nr:radical SAM protein [Elusimicrobiota bacterium]